MSSYSSLFGNVIATFVFCVMTVSQNDTVKGEGMDLDRMSGNRCLCEVDNSAGGDATIMVMVEIGVGWDGVGEGGPREGSVANTRG